MKKRSFIKLAAGAAFAACAALSGAMPAVAQSKEIVYLTPGLDLPFWRAVSNGVEATAKERGYGFQALDSRNDPQVQLKNAQDAIARGVSGIVLSPTDSSTAPSVQALAEKAKIPVVIADIGTNSGEYVTYVSSNNYEGAAGVGEALGAIMKEKGVEGGKVGIIGISQARQNGQARTKGFKDALAKAGITGDAGLQQMQSYTVDETFRFTQDMVTANPDMAAIFIQTDQPSLGALRALKAARKSGDVIVAAFDGIPEFVDLLKSGEIAVTGMQQPYLMGQKSGGAIVDHLEGKPVEKSIVVPILAVTSANVDAQLDTIKQTVFGGE